MPARFAGVGPDAGGLGPAKLGQHALMLGRVAHSETVNYIQYRAKKLL